MVRTALALAALVLLACRSPRPPAAPADVAVDLPPAVGEAAPELPTGDYLFLSASLFTHPDPATGGDHIGFGVGLFPVRLTRTAHPADDGKFVGTFTWEGRAVEVSIPAATGWPGLCLRRAVRFHDGDLAVSLPAGAWVRVDRLGAAEAEIGASDLTAVVPSAWLSADACAYSSPRLPAGPALAVPTFARYRTCLFAAPGRALPTSEIDTDHAVVLEEKPGWRRVAVANGPVVLQGWLPDPGMAAPGLRPATLPVSGRLVQLVGDLERPADSTQTALRIPAGSYGTVDDEGRVELLVHLGSEGMLSIDAEVPPERLRAVRSLPPELTRWSFWESQIGLCWRPDLPAGTGHVRVDGSPAPAPPGRDKDAIRSVVRARLATGVRVDLESSQRTLQASNPFPNVLVGDTEVEPGSEPARRKPSSLAVEVDRCAPVLRSGRSAPLLVGHLGRARLVHNRTVPYHLGRWRAPRRGAVGAPIVTSDWRRPSQARRASSERPPAPACRR